MLEGPDSIRLARRPSLLLLYDGIDRSKLYKIIPIFRKPKILVRKATPHRKRTKQGDELVPILMNLPPELIIQKVSVNVKSKLFYKPYQIMIYGDEINIMADMTYQQTK